MQREQRQVLAAHADHRRLVAGHAADVVGAGLQRLDDVGQRDHVVDPLDGDDQAVEDRQGQRQADAHPRTHARRRIDVDAPAHGLDVAFHHVHADAAPGQLGDGLGGGEAGQEDQLPDLVVAHPVMHRQAALAGLGEDALARQAAAVVGNLHHDTAALVAGGESHRAAGRLAGGEALGGRFDAVVDAVAHDVGERVAEFLDDALVQLGVFAVQLQLDLLAETRRGVVHQPRKTAEDEADRQHADRHHRFLQIAGVVFELREGLLQALVEGRVEVLAELAEHRLGDHQFADQIDQAVDLFHADA
ncbi:hypothetical protein D3C78_996160 [compost metagenome]